ncbi:MAG: T9SS type A sorting domain-containing protein [Rhodothermales bacterium]|nr:T9SS type A sorting domain-containing protein [Rhodothermales bacterium]
MTSTIKAFTFIIVSGLIISPQNQVFQTLELRSPFEEAGGNFGRSVAGVGDVNMDGFDDIVVGADLEDAGGLNAAGRAYVFSGATGDTLYSLESPSAQVNGRFGGSAAGLGDVNSDGHSDFAIAAWNEDNGGVTGVGRVFVYSGQTGSILYVVESPVNHMGGSFGAKIANAGDVNNDGLADLAVGALSQDLPGFDNAGKAYVFDGLNGAEIRTLESPNPEVNGAFGNWVDTAGDINNDGHAELIVGAFFEESDSSPFAAGMAYIFDGQSGSVLHELSSFNETSDGFFGGYVASAGDVNNDGVLDVLVGARGENSSEAGSGRVYVFDGMSGDNLFSLESPSPEQDGLFGSVAGIGDVDGDGFDDFVVGAAGEAGGAGRVYVYSGMTRDTLFTFLSPNASENGFMGARVEVAGDVDGDGKADVVVSATREEPAGSPVDAGRAYVFCLLNPTVDGLFDEPADHGQGVNIKSVFPNPGLRGTTIEFETRVLSPVIVEIFDTLGRRTVRLMESTLPDGIHSVEWNGNDTGGMAVPSGTYIVRVSSGSFRHSRLLRVVH